MALRSHFLVPCILALASTAACGGILLEGDDAAETSPIEGPDARESGRDTGWRPDQDCSQPDTGSYDSGTWETSWPYDTAAWDTRWSYDTAAWDSSWIYDTAAWDTRWSYDTAAWDTGWAYDTGGPETIDSNRCPDQLPSGPCNGYTSGLTCKYRGETDGCPATYVAVCQYAGSTGTQSWKYSASIDPGCATKCPTAPPGEGVRCSLAGQLCSYKTDCNEIFASCTGESWLVKTASTCACPTTKPRQGTACSARGQVCTYGQPCGTDTAFCDGVGWIVKESLCDGCPGLQPAQGAACSQTSQSCAWINQCGNQVLGVCTQGRWLLADPGCSYCPPQQPRNGDSCSANESEVCTYASPMPGGASCSGCACVPLTSQWLCLPAQKCTLVPRLVVDYF